MSARHDLVARARSVRLEDELDRRGIRLAGRGPNRCGPCPICGGTDRFGINTAKGVFYCRGCQRGGDIIALVRFLDGCDFAVAVETLTGGRLVFREYGETFEFNPD